MKFKSLPFLSCAGLFSLVLLTAFRSFAWELNDVSILLPLPAASEINQLIPPAARGVGVAALLPYEDYAQLPLILVGRDRRMIYDSALRVVAIRFDPCFHEGSGPQACRRQIRLVWQPVYPKGPSTFAEDGAVHTFYDLSEIQWQRVVAQLRAMNVRSGLIPRNLPLQIHPILRHEGYQGPFWQGLRDLILGACSAVNLSRVTAMTMYKDRLVWAFTGYDKREGRLTHVRIPGIDPQLAQAAIMTSPVITQFSTTISPLPATEKAFPLILRSGPNPVNEADAEVATKRALEIENPRLANTGTVDCASCHVTRAVTPWARQRFPAWDWKMKFADVLYQGPGDLRATMPQTGNTRVLRAFGYIDREPVVSARVINETSALLRMMP